jgi:hypothetical protein
VNCIKIKRFFFDFTQKIDVRRKSARAQSFANDSIINQSDHTFISKMFHVVSAKRSRINCFNILRNSHELVEAAKKEAERCGLMVGGKDGEIHLCPQTRLNLNGTIEMRA